MQKTDNAAKQIHRILDANINRAEEGLRVCEEITRFILSDKKLSAKLKKARHLINSLQQKYFCKIKLLESRCSRRDVGQRIYGNELSRKHCQDVFLANFQRVKESIRVLEEFSKLSNKLAALEFKNLRYQLYEIEKESFKKISSLRNYK